MVKFKPSSDVRFKIDETSLSGCFVPVVGSCLLNSPKNDEVCVFYFLKASS